MISLKLSLSIAVSIWRERLPFYAISGEGGASMIAPKSLILLCCLVIYYKEDGDGDMDFLFFLVEADDGKATIWFCFSLWGIPGISILFALLPIVSCWTLVKAIMRRASHVPSTNGLFVMSTMLFFGR